MKFNENGRSMIEMLGVLAIVGVLSVAGIMGYSKAMSKYKSNTIMNGITHTINNVKTLFMQQGNFKGLTTEEAYNAGVIPEEFKKDTENLEKIVHAYGGTVEVVAKKVDGTDADDNTAGVETVYYAVRISGLPKDVAMEIATKDWGESGDLVSVNLNNGKTDENTESDVQDVNP